VNIGYKASTAISVLGNDAYAYSALYDACMYGGVNSFARSSTGMLDNGAGTANRPTPPPEATSDGVSLPIYRPGLTATDTSNHVAMVEYPCFALNGAADTQLQLATYTADASGNLTTADTYATMPTLAVNSPQALEMSPSGSLLAVGGVGGLQVFHFNGASPITSFTELLTSDSIEGVFWDKSNHLYAFSRYPLGSGSTIGSGRLHVFTVTDTGASEAPGSPYAIAGLQSLAVVSQ
jgi:hypothetical protein